MASAARYTSPFRADDAPVYTPEYQFASPVTMPVAAAPSSNPFAAPVNTSVELPNNTDFNQGGLDAMAAQGQAALKATPAVAAAPSGGGLGGAGGLNLISSFLEMNGQAISNQPVSTDTESGIANVVETGIASGGSPLAVLGGSIKAWEDIRATRKAEKAHRQLLAEIERKQKARDDLARKDALGMAADEREAVRKANVLAKYQNDMQRIQSTIQNNQELQDRWIKTGYIK